MKKVKITTIILAIILVTLVAFVGVYIKTQNRMENKVKDYTFGRDIKGARVVEVKVPTAEDTKPNAEDLTVENFETVKNTIEKRLKSFGAHDYNIALNEENGTMIVELSEDVNTDVYVYLLTADAKVQIKEKDGNTELLKDAMIEKSLYTYTADTEGAYQVYLELHLTEEGKAKFEEIKNNYAVFEDEVEKIKAAEEAKKAEQEKAKEGEKTEEGTAETTTDEKAVVETKNEETKKIAVLTVAGTEYDIEKIEKEKLMVKIGGETKNGATVNSNISTAAELATLINAGKYPITYEIGENKFIYSDITEQHLIYIASGMAIVMLIAFVVFIIKYKGRGFLASISFVGFISILSLVLRYTNVSISLEGIGALILTIIINIRINRIILRDGKDIDYKDLALKLVPVVIITLVFSFAGWSNLSSFGLIMFWGLALTAVYNIVVTKTLLKLKESK